jgi:hypothetical protein
MAEAESAGLRSRFSVCCFWFFWWHVGYPCALVDFILVRPDEDDYFLIFSLQALFLIWATNARHVRTVSLFDLPFTVPS